MPNNNLPDDFQIVQNVNFDPMAILHGEGALSKEPLIEKKTDDVDPTKKASDTVAAKRPPIELSDEMLMQGFKNASGESSKNAGGPTGNKNDIDTGGKAPNTADDDDKGDDKTKVIAGTEDRANAFAVHYKAMVEAGEWEEIEGFDGTEEKYVEAKNFNLGNQANQLADSYFDEAFKQNPQGKDMGLKLFNHLRSGGKVSDFVDIYAADDLNYDDIESEDDDVATPAAKQLISEYYTAIGWKKDKINAKIANLERTGQLVNEAKDVKEPYQDLNTQQQTIHQQNLERQKAIDADNRRKNTEAIKKLIDANEGFGPLKLYNSPKEKRDFEEYMFVPDDKTGTTGFKTDLEAGLKDPKFLLFAATAYRNKLHENADALKIDPKEATSKAVSGLRQTLENSLLNKGISQNKDTNSDVKKQSSGYQFDLDKAIVLT